MRTTLAPTLLTLLTLLTALAASPAFAQEEAAAEATADVAVDPRLEEARSLFNEAEAHFRAQRFLLAAQTFERTHALMVEIEHPNTAMVLYNIGRSLESVPGRERDARTAYQRFLESANAEDPALRQPLSETQARIRELDARIAAAEAEPHEGEGEEEPPPASGGGVSMVGVAILGVGAAALIGGAITGGLTIAGSGEVTESCNESTLICDPAVEDRAREVQTLANVTDGLLIGGAVIAATGLVLMFALADGGHEDEAGQDETSPEEPSAEASAYCDAYGCGAVVRGRF